MKIKKKPKNQVELLPERRL